MNKDKINDFLSDNGFVGGQFLYPKATNIMKVYSNGNEILAYHYYNRKKGINAYIDLFFNPKTKKIYADIGFIDKKIKITKLSISRLISIVNNLNK